MEAILVIPLLILLGFTVHAFYLAKAKNDYTGLNTLITFCLYMLVTGATVLLTQARLMSLTRTGSLSFFVFVLVLEPLVGESITSTRRAPAAEHDCWPPNSLVASAVLYYILPWRT